MAPRLPILSDHKRYDIDVQWKLEQHNCDISCATSINVIDTLFTMQCEVAINNALCSK